MTFDTVADLPDLSVVTMLYRSEPFVSEFYHRMVAAAERVTSQFEIVFVDDGSPDRAAELVTGLVEQDSRVVLVELSRNFGHHQAAVAGLRHARGRRVFILDVDLEEQPEWLPEFASEFDATGADVVFGVNANRQGSLPRRVSGALFWRLFNLLSDTQVPANSCTVRLMSRRYLDALMTLRDRNVFLAGNFAWLGFKQVPKVVQKSRRPGPSSYTLPRLTALFVNAVTSFTSYPLWLIFLAGVAIAGLSFLAGAALIIRKLANPDTILLGWASVIVSIWFLGGLIIALLGVIGIYLSKVFNETKERPLFIVREVRRQTELALSGPDHGPR